MLLQELLDRLNELPEATRTATVVVNVGEAKDVEVDVDKVEYEHGTVIISVIE